jgi:RNA polymerase sigma-70 factor, ECF subfamily
VTQSRSALPGDAADARGLRLAATDRDLLERLRTGDSRAFEVLFRQYFEPLWRFTIGYVASPDVARDIVHDLFANVWERRETLVVQTSVAAYLYTAARNRAMNYLRHERRVTAWGRMWRHDADAPVEVSVGAADEAATVRRAIAALPERQRQVVVLRWFHGLTNPEAAAVLGVSRKAVESLLVRAFTTLRSRLSVLR